MTLPTATVHPAWAPARRFFAALGKATAIGVVAAMLVGLTIGASKAGCRNDAITYAKALYPEASCDAIQTDTGCNGQPETAVCRVGDRRLFCTTGWSGEGVHCKEVR